MKIFLAMIMSIATGFLCYLIFMPPSAHWSEFGIYCSGVVTCYIWNLITKDWVL